MWKLGPSDTKGGQKKIKNHRTGAQNTVQETRRNTAYKVMRELVRIYLFLYKIQRNMGLNNTRTL